MCRRIPVALVCQEDVKKFFIQKWAPEIKKIHQPGGGAIDDILQDVIDQTADLELCEVCTLYEQI